MRRYPEPKPRHPNGSWSPNRDRGRQAKARTQALERDGYTCTECGHHDPTGNSLRACHLKPLRHGGSYELANIATRCTRCDRDTDPYAR